MDANVQEVVSRCHCFEIEEAVGTNLTPVRRLVTVAPERLPGGARRDPRGARRITLSLFRCNDKEIFAEFKAAVDRGVDVEVLVTSRAKGGKKKLASCGARSRRPAPRCPPIPTRS